MEKLNIYQKLVEVRKSIEGWEKDQKGFGYSYVSGSQVLGKIKNKMDELGIILETHIESYNWAIHKYINAKGKEVQDFVVDGSMLMVWVNSDSPEDRVEVQWHYAGQQDDVSKALGSGLTYCERYFMLKQFGVPTDYDDPDKKQPEAPLPKSQTVKPPTTVKPTSPPTTNQVPTTPATTPSTSPVLTSEDALNFIVETGANKGKKMQDLQDFQVKWLIGKTKNPQEELATNMVLKSREGE